MMNTGKYYVICDRLAGASAARWLPAVAIATLPVPLEDNQPQFENELSELEELFSTELASSEG